MRIAALVSLLSFFLVGSIVGARALLVARRTRQAPELLIGLSLLSITLLGYPFCLVGRLPGLVATPVGNALFAVGLLVAVSGIGFLFAFTVAVFRPGSRAARRAVVTCGLALLGFAIGLLHASLTASGTTFAEIMPRTRPWAGGIVAMVTLAFGWSGVESGLFYRKLRRRLALGLADPVLANRFLLWSVSGSAVALLCAANVGYLASGMMLMRDPLPLVTISAAGITGSAAWYLTFLPPDAYLNWVRRRAVHPSA